MFKDLIYAGVKYNNFEINELGDVRNKKTGTIYKKSINKGGYYFVTLPLGKRGKVKSIRIHKALAEVFIPNPYNYKVVNHMDENKLNINLDNLEWTTSKKNTQYYLQNRYAENIYSNNRKLTKNDIDFIRNNKSISNKKLAKMFNVSSTTISNVKNNKLYIGV